MFKADARSGNPQDPDQMLYLELTGDPNAAPLLPGMVEFLEHQPEGNQPSDRGTDCKPK